MRGERLPGRIDPERREEDLKGQVRVERAGDLADPGQVPVNEARDAIVVVQGALPASAADVQRALGETEVALDIDENQVVPPQIGRRGQEVVLASKQCRGRPPVRHGRGRAN